jgi:CRISPR-associated endonuclease/helicase Cas3
VTLSRGDFPAFFAAVNHGHAPYAWQERLLDVLLATGRWPGRLAAPTGAGKTSVIDVHVFAVALMAVGVAPRLPRRLAMVVDRRVLVDDQHDRARSLAEQLADPESDAVARVAAALLPLSRTIGPDGGRQPLVTARLRGGLPPSRRWRDDPTACAVICATPDMFGSRLLFRGYGTANLAAPREAGLLAFDSVAVVDEAHLARQLLVTARRVGQLATVTDRPLGTVPPLHVVETTATPQPDPEVSTVAVDDGDLSDPALADRLTRPKPVTLRRVPGWPGARPGPRVVTALVDAVLDLLSAPSAPGEPVHTVGCFVNTVPAALAVSQSLRSRRLDGRPLSVVTVCGQTRPADIDRLRDRHPGLLTPPGNRDIDVLVTTQSLEVGVDLDLAGLVTELAPGSALAQRAGRVNRRGLRASGPVTVVGPDGEVGSKDRSGPYGGEDLAAAVPWLSELAGDRAGMSPWAVRDRPPPGAMRRRTLYQRPELADAWHWARTSDSLAAEPELELWLTEDLEPGTTVGLVVRDALPVDIDDATQLLRELPPQAREVFPLPYRTARRILLDLMPAGTGPGAGEAKPSPTPVRVRGEEIEHLRTRPSSDDGSPVPAIRPGDVVVVDSSSAVFVGGRVVGAGRDVFSPAVPVDAEIPGRVRAEDVLHEVPAPRAGEVAVRLEGGPDGAAVAGVSTTPVNRLLGDLAEEWAEASESRRRRLVAEGITALLRTEGAVAESVTGMLRGAVALLTDARVRDSHVSLYPPGEPPVRLIIRDARRLPADDEGLRQVLTPRRADGVPVLLAEHQRVVGVRAGELGVEVGLEGEVVAVLRLAGDHHDDGKQDPRFQVRLGADQLDPPGGLLAKSPPDTTLARSREREQRAGLPARWRHEQRSVVDAWDTITRDCRESGLDADLVARLVGTSHGHGRTGFPHAGSELVTGSPPALVERARQLFDAGEWDELIERTHHRYGVWGCAYVEALLRAADGQVSAEGS